MDRGATVVADPPGAAPPALPRPVQPQWVREIGAAQDRARQARIEASTREAERVAHQIERDRRSSAAATPSWPRLTSRSPARAPRSTMPSGRVTGSSLTASVSRASRCDRSSRKAVPASPARAGQQALDHRLLRLEQAVGDLAYTMHGATGADRLRAKGHAPSQGALTRDAGDGLRDRMAASRPSSSLLTWSTKRAQASCNEATTRQIPKGSREPQRREGDDPLLRWGGREPSRTRPFRSRRNAMARADYVARD
jgi:hypothetical protein